MTSVIEKSDSRTLRETAVTVKEVKEFEKSLGIEPTDALNHTTENRAPYSLLWLWLQRVGTLALRTPIDVRLTLGFAASQGAIPVERIYRVDGYSVYFRQGNEFSDEKSVTTIDFARSPLMVQVRTIIHEDLHGDETAEALVAGFPDCCHAATRNYPPQPVAAG